MPGSSRCRTCHAYILWARTTTGGVMPIDWRRNPDGNVVLVFEPNTDKPLAMVVGPADTLSPDAKAMPRHMPHYATCPQADEWRRKK